MSYAATATFGDTEPIDDSNLDSGDVFVWRAVVNSELSSIDLLLRIVRAVGKRCFHAWWGPVKFLFGFDVRGAVVRPDRRGLDLVLRKGRDGCAVATIALYPDGIAQAVMEDDDVRAFVPGLEVTGQFLRMTGPTSALDFWRRHGLMWESGLGPTDLFTHDGGLYVGAADSVQTIKPLTRGQVTPAVTDPKPLPGAPPVVDSGGVSALLVLGTIAVVWFASTKLWRKS